MIHSASPAARSALLAGASGLIGQALLARLLGEGAYRQVTVLARGRAKSAQPDSKLDWREVDFEHLPEPLPTGDDVYLALGTTIKVAGSESAFRRVDFDYVVGIARAARAAGATRLAVVSALGADSASRVFYNRVKGDMQAAVAGLGYTSVVIAQPSLLMGDRAALGQPVRRFESLAAGLLAPVMALVPKAVRPIAAATVANALVRTLLTAPVGVVLLGSGRMQEHANS